MDTNNDFCSQSTTFNNISWPKQGAKTQFCFRRQIKCPADKVTGSTLVIKTVQMGRSDVVKQKQEKRALFSKNLIHLYPGFFGFQKRELSFATKDGYMVSPAIGGSSWSHFLNREVTKTNLTGTPRVVTATWARVLIR